MTKICKKNNTGFTLLEMIIYIALFSFMIGGLIMTSFMLVQNSHKTENRITVQGEMNFVLKKINWVINQAKDIDIPSSNILSANADNDNENEFEIKYENNKITLNNKEITTINVSVDKLSFETIGENPKGVKITLIINGQEVNYTKYLIVL
jgi:type II secretory pathway component PulJ